MFRGIHTKLHPVILRTAMSLIVLMVCCHVGFAQNVGWFNGTFGGDRSLNNFQNPDGTARQLVFDDFVVPSGGWHIVGVFSYNIENYAYPNSVTHAHWEIRSGIIAPDWANNDPGSLGTVVAEGTASASWEFIGVVGTSNYAIYKVAVSNLNVNLAEGTYWLAVAPGDVTSNPPTGLCSTSGDDAVGTPPGNNGNSFFIGTGSLYPEDLSARFGVPSDYSLGIIVGTPPVPDFSVLVEPPSQSVKAGKSASYLLSVQRVNGFADTVAFTCSQSIPAATCTITANTDGSASATVDTAPGKRGTPRNSYQITFTGTSGVLSRSQTVTLTVK
jgi:hypothetical protein